MPDVTIKSETIGKYYIELRLVNRYGYNSYVVTLNYEAGAGYRTEKQYQGYTRKNSMTVYSRYKKLANNQ